MIGTMVKSSEYHGSLVAFEGPEDIISTQLRLLPNSSKLLILPSFQYFVRESDAGSRFDARLLILRTHEACNVRTEMARTFLRGSTPDNKRLVFMNGGTISARMNCISAISKYETNGDIIKAEVIFNELIQNGTASLKPQSKPQQNAGVTSRVDAVTDVDEQDDDLPDDPISKAMRAADALYLETSFLQDSDEFDLITAIRPRSMSVPALPMVDDIKSAAPLYVFGPTDRAEQACLPVVREQDQLLHIENWRAMTAGEDQLLDMNTVPKSPSRLGDIYPYNPLRPTSAVGPPNATVESIPNSPVLLGEARIVDIRPPMPPIHERIKSVDRIYATAIRSQDISLCNFQQSALAKLEEHAQNKTQEDESGAPKKPILRSNFYSETSYPTFVKPSKTIVRKHLPPPLTLDIEGATQSTSYISQNIEERHCVHGGTLAEPILNMRETRTEDSDSFVNLGDGFEPDANEVFQAVLPMTEDLVIHFKGERGEPGLEAMIRAFNNGTSQISMSSLLSELNGSMDQPMTPTTSSSARNRAERDDLYSRQGTQESTPIYSPDEYDPFASHGNHVGRPFTCSLPKQDMGSRPQETIVISTPPTPAQTPPPGTNTLADKLFHDFDIKECKTAICIQNALRSILNVYFPPENIGYHQFNFPLLPELSSFWRPVFREMPSRDSDATRKIDLILAIGAQKSANRGFLGAISGSLEKLGREANGASRSGRLDLRYLIANAMQAFTSQPLANQTQDNPFSNPLLLATLIIPHLETYIAAHSATRFLLLEYPAEYLSTVLSLQHLIGVDLLKVAGIIDAETSDPTSYRAYRKQSSHTLTSSPTSSASTGGNATLLSLKASTPKLEGPERMCTPQPSFSKANFILTSTAGESEIATFISTIWRILIDISDFYIPESITVANWKSNSNNRLLSSSSLIHSKEQDAPLFRAAVILGFAQSPEDEQQQQQAHQRSARPNYVSNGTYADLPTPTQRPVTPIKSSKASITEALRSGSATCTPRTPRIARNPHNKLQRILGHEAAAFTAVRDAETEDAAHYHDLEGEEEDSGLWAEERKYMPLWSHQNSPRKSNSRKALKWLGLAN
ncbi:hypothetical protein F4823DRAFT_44667 [Ustulina deusta]|nr:hypothetical protein F4823DRAFT_44667 [Ustulina deusta]